MVDFDGFLKREFYRLGFRNVEEMKTIAEYPENMTFLHYRESTIKDKPIGYFIDFNFVIIYEPNSFPQVTYITATLHLRESPIKSDAWIVAEKSYWRDDGPFPKKEQMITEVLNGEKGNLFAAVN